MRDNKERFADLNRLCPSTAREGIGPRRFAVGECTQCAGCDFTVGNAPGGH